MTYGETQKRPSQIHRTSGRGLPQVSRKHDGRRSYEAGRSRKTSPMESRPPNLGRPTYRNTRQTRQSTIRRLTQKPVHFKNEQVCKTSKALENNIFSWASFVHVSLNEFDTPFTFAGK